jgi:hypothetical protein
LKGSEALQNRLFRCAFHIGLALGIVMGISSVQTAQAQEVSVGYRVKIKPHMHILQSATREQCTPEANIECPASGMWITGGERLTALGGRANVYVNPTHRNLLHVNYWYGGSRPNPNILALNSQNPVIVLANRDLVTFQFQSLNFAPAAMPIRVRTRQTRGGITAPEAAAPTVNAGALTTYQIGRLSYRHEAHSTNAPYVSWQVGPAVYVGLSSEKLDASNMRLSQAPVVLDRNLLVGSLGLGVAGGFRDFNLMLMFGRDRGLTDGAGQWDYNKGRWYGLGIGLKPFARLH